MSRREAVTPDIQEQFCAMVGLGYSRRRAAYALGFSESTMRSAMQRNEEFAHRLLRAEQRREILVLKNVRDATTKSWRAAKWYLERIAPEAYGTRPNETGLQRALAKEGRSTIDVILNEIRDPALRGSILSKLRRLQDRTEMLSRWAEGLPSDVDRDALLDRCRNATWLEQLADACDPDDAADPEATWDGPQI